MHFSVPRIAALAAFLWSGVMPAAAHPHVFVDARAEIFFDDGGRVSAVRNIWKFDDAFSVFATEGLDKDGDGKLSPAELETLAKVNVESLAQFGFFTQVGVGEDQIKFGPVKDYLDTFDAGRLTLEFTLPLERPVAIDAGFSLAIYDQEYFVAFDFLKDIPVTLKGAPPRCEATYHPPRDIDEKTFALLAQIPADQRELPPDLAAIVRDVGSHITVACH